MGIPVWYRGAACEARGQATEILSHQMGAWQQGETVGSGLRSHPSVTPPTDDPADAEYFEGENTEEKSLNIKGSPPI